MMDKSEFKIRDFKSKDYPQLLQFWEETGLGGAERADNLRVIKRCKYHGGRIFLLISKKTGEIIGTSWITFDGRRFFLHHFGIKSDYQHKGLGHFLADETMKFVQKKGFQIKLEVHKSNKAAKALYEKFGFQLLENYEIHINRKP